MVKSLRETVKTLLAEGAASATLSPGGGDPPKKIAGEVVDHGAPLVKVTDPKKDLAKSNSKVPARPADKAGASEPTKKLTSANIKEEDDEEEELEEVGNDSSKEEEILDEETEEETEEEEDMEGEPSVKDSYKFEIDVTEDVNAMFNGSELSEEFKTKATDIFEAALVSNLQKYKNALDEEYDETIAAAIVVIGEEMETKVEKYLNYVSEQWLAENEVAIESSLRTELTEDFIAGLRNLFLENFIDIPEEKVDMIEEMSGKVHELEEKLNEEIKKNIALIDDINEANKVNIIATVTEGLTDTQIEKIADLAMVSDFISEEDFTKKVSTLRENYFPVKGIKKDTTLIAEISEDPDAPIIKEELIGNMAKYATAIGKSLPR